MRYVVLMTIDRHVPGEDVTDVYPRELADLLVSLGYLEQIDSEGVEDGGH